MAEPTPILWVSCVAEKGGAEVYMINFLRHLDPSRYRPAVVLLAPGPLDEELRGLGIGTHVLRRHRMREVHRVGQAIAQIARTVGREGYRLVHSNCFRGHVYGGLAARLAGVPEVWSVHTVEKPGWSTRAILSVPTHHVTANCPRTAGYFVEQRLPTSMIWPGVELAGLEDRTSRAELASRYGIPAGARWVGLGARMQRYKGHEFLIRAVAALPAALGDVQVVLMGGNLFGMEREFRGELEQLAGRLGLSGRVHFTGFVPNADMRGIVAACDLMVHPALDEDFGLIVAESQAMGVPVLAYASVGPAAILEDGVTGRLVPVGDQEALNRELAALLADPARLRRMGEAGRARIPGRFGAPLAGARLARIYDAVLDGRQPALDTQRQPVLEGVPAFSSPPPASR